MPQITYHKYLRSSDNLEFKQKRTLQKWNQQEDQLLIDNVKVFKKNWDKVTEAMEGRSKNQCIQRWQRLFPNKKQNKWTKEEDKLLIKLVETYEKEQTSFDNRKMWKQIQNHLPRWTNQQIRQRYINVINPNINQDFWSKDEDELLIANLKEHGKRWSLISKCMKIRSENQIKNRYNSFISKVYDPENNYEVREQYEGLVEKANKLYEEQQTKKNEEGETIEKKVKKDADSEYEKSEIDHTILDSPKSPSFMNVTLNQYNCNNGILAKLNAKEVSTPILNAVNPENCQTLPMNDNQATINLLLNILAKKQMQEQQEQQKIQQQQQQIALANLLSQQQQQLMQQKLQILLQSQKVNPLMNTNSIIANAFQQQQQQNLNLISQLLQKNY